MTNKTLKDNINCDAIECNSLKLNFNVCTAGFGCESRFVAAACPCREYLGHSDSKSGNHVV
jgi:hypothetical protein